MDEMQKTLARRRAAVERKEPESVQVIYYLLANHFPLPRKVLNSNFFRRRRKIMRRKIENSGIIKMQTVVKVQNHLENSLFRLKN